MTTYVHMLDAKLLKAIQHPYQQQIITDPEHILLRYTELGFVGTYQMWKGDRIEQRYAGIDTLPEWLQAIVTLGKVGDHFIMSQESPPAMILWAELDGSKGLVRFIRHTT